MKISYGAITVECEASELNAIIAIAKHFVPDAVQPARAKNQWFQDNIVSLACTWGRLPNMENAEALRRAVVEYEALLKGVS